MTDNPLWQYSLAVYGRPAVAEACLALQDEHGADVNLLLCGCWLATAGRRWSETELAELCALSRPQREHIAAMRTLRRSLKDAAPAPVYQQAKQLELALERWQQDTLWHYWRERQSTGGDDFAAAATANIGGYLATLGAGAAKCEALLRQLVVAAG